MWSFPWQPDQKASAEREGGPALMHAPTLPSPNLYFLGSLPCVPCFLGSFPSPFYGGPPFPCPFPIAWALLSGIPRSPWSSKFAAHIRGSRPSRWGVTVSPLPQPHCDLSFVQGGKCKEGEASGRKMKSSYHCSLPTLTKSPVSRHSSVTEEWRYSSRSRLEGGVCKWKVHLDLTLSRTDQMLFPYSTVVREVPDLYRIETSKTMKQVYCPAETEVLWEGFVFFFLIYSLEKASKIFHSSIHKASNVTLRLKLWFLCTGE